MRETNFTLGPIQKSLYLLLLYQFHLPKIWYQRGTGSLGPIHYITLKPLLLHWGMGPSVKHVLGVLEWSYVPWSLKNLFSSKIEFGLGWLPLPGLAKDHTFHVKFSVQHSLCKPAFATLTLKADLLWSRRTGLLAFSETVKLRFQDSEFHNQLQRDFHG